MVASGQQHSYNLGSRFLAPAPAARTSWSWQSGGQVGSNRYPQPQRYATRTAAVRPLGSRQHSKIASPENLVPETNNKGTLMI